jgi:superfamily II DNA or RNA helicase
MTSTPRVIDHGPLFGWLNGPERPDHSGPLGLLRIAEEFPGALALGLDGPDQVVPDRRPLPNSPTISNGPSGPEDPDHFSEKANDSKQTRDRCFLPLRGEETPDASLAPSGSSAALTLRSQRTDQGGLGAPRGSGDRDRDQTPEDRRPTLRPYQLAALAGIDAQHERGSLRTLLELPTGCGKTVVFAEWARRRVDLGRRVLVLAHRSELLEQAHRKLTDVGVLAGIEQADRRAGHAPVVVASVQTLQGPRLKRLPPDDFDLVIDEAHHATAASYRRILDHFPFARVVAVTATADRADGTALGEVFSSVAFRYGLREAIAAGYLAPIIARRIFLEGVDLSSVRSRAGDLAQDELAAILGTEEAVHGVVGPLLEQTAGKRTIVFAVNVAHAKAIAEVINRHKPDAARAVDGSAPDYERRAVVGAFSAGRFQYLVNCALFTEGFDEPSIECVAIARPTKSRALVMQMVGRGTRLSPSTGKTSCLWLDFAGNAGRHRLVGPVDALAAGDVPDDVRAEAERMLGESAGDVDQALEAAELALAERRRAAKVTASARYFSDEVDPFFGELADCEPILESWASEIATMDDRLRLDQLGWSKLAKGQHTTRGDAAKIFRATEARRAAGLCSYKQSRLLQRFGIAAKTLTAAAAGRRIDVLASCSWDPVQAAPRLRKLAADELLRKAGNQ